MSGTNGCGKEENKMGKYANHEGFGVNALINYREDTTSESYLNISYVALRAKNKGVLEATLVAICKVSTKIFDVLESMKTGAISER